MALHNGGTLIYIDHKAWQQVALAVDKAVAGCGLVADESQCLAQCTRLGNATVPPRLIDILALKGEHAHRNGAYLPMSASYEVTLLGDNIDNIALGEWLHALGDALNGARKYPRVAAEK